MKGRSYAKQDSSNELTSDTENEASPRKTEIQLAADSSSITDMVQETLSNALSSKACYLDLSKMSLRVIPQKLLEIASVKNLYLSHNKLSHLPDIFFDCLPLLEWLDLRHNCLVAIPTMYIGSHLHLRVLLLEGNRLTTLPLELGLIPTLNALNIANNPLQFPPKPLLEQGTKAICQLFREMLQAKSEGRFNSAIPRIEDLKLTEAYSDTDSPSSDDNDDGRHRRSMKRHSWTGEERRRSFGSVSDGIDIQGPVPHSASIHRLPSYGKVKQRQHEKFRKAGALGTVKHTPKKKKKLREVNRYPSPPPIYKIEQRFLEDQRLSQIRHIKENQEDILQRRRNSDYLREWRQDGKTLQQEKYKEYILGGNKDPIDIATQAPFGIENAHLKIQTNEERIKQDVKETHERMRAMTPNSVYKAERERAARDSALQGKLKEHMSQMMERRNKPKGTPQEEMMSAKRELEIAEQLQKEIEHRRKALEYRFTAFTGDNPS